MSVELRPAGPEDVAFLAALAAHEEVEPFMAARAAREPEEIRVQVERSQAEPQEHGRFVVEVDGAPAGAVAFEVTNRRSRIAHLYGLMLDPDFRGRGLGAEAARQLARHLLLELGYHRVQLECYGFNERAMRLFERVGFVREGVKRKAYRRHGEWVDGVMFGLIREDWE